MLSLLHSPLELNEYGGDLVMVVINWYVSSRVGWEPSECLVYSGTKQARCGYVCVILKYSFIVKGLVSSTLYRFSAVEGLLVCS